MAVKIKMEMTLPVVIEKKEKWHVAKCPVLDVVSQGETPEKAKANLAEALFLFLTSCYEHGTLETVLKQCGFKTAVGSDPLSLEPPHVDTDEFLDIPFYLLSGNSDQNQCRA